MWKSEEDKLNKSGRKWKPSLDYMPYRCAELFCEKCGTSLGIHDIVCTNLETIMYCKDCVQKYIKQVPSMVSRMMLMNYIFLTNGQKLICRRLSE